MDRPMRLLTADELPSRALAAVHGLLESDGGYAWESDQRTFAVVMRWDDETPAYTVVRDGEGFTVWDVT